MPRKKTTNIDADALDTHKTKRRPAKPKAEREPSVILNDQQKAYVDARASGLEKTPAAIAAGYKGNSPSIATELEKHPGVRDLLQAEQRKNAYMLGITRETVLQGMMDAVADAKALADPMAQIAGWREIAKICGYYAPEVKKIELSAGAKTVLQRMEQMDDEELLRLAESEIIDVEFTEVRHDH